MSLQVSTSDSTTSGWDGSYYYYTQYPYYVKEMSCNCNCNRDFIEYLKEEIKELKEQLANKKAKQEQRRK